MQRPVQITLRDVGALGSPGSAHPREDSEAGDTMTWRQKSRAGLTARKAEPRGDAVGVLLREPR